MNDTILIIFATTFAVIFTVYMIVSEYRTCQQVPPDGKIFVKEFSEIVSDIYRAQEISGFKFLYSFQNNITFKVSVKQDDTPEGLEYRTIPVYKSFSIYINDELVCREHIFKDKHYFEFSSKRKRDEVITLVKESREHAKEILRKDNEELYERLGLVSKSFFDYSFNNDVEDI